MAEPKTRASNTARDDHKAAVDAEAADYAKATPAMNACLTGGKSAAPIDSETAHRVAASIARDTDRGHSRPLAEHVREARRR